MSSVRKRLLGLRRARDGAVMVEFSMIVSLLLLVTCGMVDFSLALYQYNGASKAAELGGRLAAVSDPVASNISTLSPTNAFSMVCSGATAACTGGGIYSAAAMQTLVYGRGKVACGAVASGQLAAMCDAYPGLTPSNVTVTYQQSGYATSGLGYAGRSGGPVPTITVEVTGVNFNFYFLNSLLGLAPMAMPTMRTTVTGEDLSTAGN
jgi:Flp pilus assembly protein TadG